MIELVFLFVGLVVGFLAAWFIAINKNKTEDVSANKNLEEFEALRSEKLSLFEQVKMLTERLEILTQQNSLKQNEIVVLTGQLAETKANFNNLKEKLENSKVELEKTQEQFSVYFKNLANDILEEKTKKFTEQNKTQLSEILQPLGEKIKDFEKKVEETYDKEAQQRFSLKEEVKKLAELN
jgi:DNA recombination protein RmuC